ncbi:hypothetical protein AYL99_05194 [Fonsecaea erecta]|uniref:Metallo-beta-lactamase domain-containing protein n=1 Tax=Fonsecaea erecta TaxID=1367422 RepID=A0A178ZKK1_9EURO|nr:hypothetical protein AYL99_05194 [Fonsecaea erecta]OAP60192.1 hypothetical protein AYL99_05194 [Fonsecaea erecta]
MALGPHSTVRVALVPTGSLYLPDKWILAGASLETKTLYPDYSFYVYHEQSGRSLMFDLGIRKDLDAYPKVIRGEFPVVTPQVPFSAAELLAQGGVDAGSIDFVVLSHLHFDHIGDPYEFPHCQVVVGPGSTEASSPGYPTDPNSPYLGSIIQHPELRELSRSKDPWIPFGPFERAFDFFNDGSFLLLDAPGHMPGHLIGVARTGEDEYVLMGGDCCHHRKIFTGEAQVAEGYGPGGASSMHKDLGEAKSTITKVHELSQREDVMVCLAHDSYLEPALKVFPAFLNGWRKSQAKQSIEEYLSKAVLDVRRM